MSLLATKQYLQQHPACTLSQLCQALQLPLDLATQMVEHWRQKGCCRFQQPAAKKACGSCRGCPMACGNEPRIEWLAA